ncbi:mitochondrial ribosomal protein L17 [Volvox carteri f. nagariensis]|uniref:Mitochondrial ribosomal protein L17 n=1 Tax=Volvox carteri f. nagariensis TaxID=3068 RepID=D8TKT1_VOLCA|nr:mitochondrial ribosomal protein L17 [Volvox carteri f. nagariensis]EFJ52119.1 mitochondrial ribosomal protein L17 [Volvox carteri f. nagariensis]|eukprot:XP_002946893.1 mitochondrial ribosomal protein L17 [Volvox carteri f. nagariensis]
MARVRLRLGNWNRLNRKWEHRVSMMKTMVTQLLEKERIRTTLAKAKTLQRYADKVITLGKKGTRDAWIQARGIIRTDRELHKLFTQIALRYRERPGGFTRLVRAGWRERDAAPVAFIELVDRPGELRPARPPLPHIEPLSVRAWMQAQLGQTPRQPSPLLPPVVQQYLRDENRLRGPDAVASLGDGR